MHGRGRSLVSEDPPDGNRIGGEEPGDHAGCRIASRQSDWRGRSGRSRGRRDRLAGNPIARGGRPGRSREGGAGTLARTRTRIGGRARASAYAHRRAVRRSAGRGRGWIRAGVPLRVACDCTRIACVVREGVRTRSYAYPLGGAGFFLTRTRIGGGRSGEMFGNSCFPAMQTEKFRV